MAVRFTYALSASDEAHHSKRIITHTRHSRSGLYQAWLCCCCCFNGWTQYPRPCFTWVWYCSEVPEPLSNIPVISSIICPPTGCLLLNVGSCTNLSARAHTHTQRRDCWTCLAGEVYQGMNPGQTKWQHEASRRHRLQPPTQWNASSHWGLLGANDALSPSKDTGLGAQSCFSPLPPSTFQPFQGPSLPSEDTGPLWMAVPRTLHGWPDSYGSNFIPHPSCRRAGGSQGWESEHGVLCSCSQLLWDAHHPRYEPKGPLLSLPLPRMINKAVIGKGQRASHSEAMERSIFWTPSWVTSDLPGYYTGIPKLRDLKPDDQRWSSCNHNRNKVHDKWNTLG